MQNGDEIFPSMLEAIRGARRSITFETYIYWSGQVGASFATALQERARAGVGIADNWQGHAQDPEHWRDMHLMYLLAIAAAEHSIDIGAAYFIPDRMMSDALIAARHRGARVRVILPGKHIGSETVKISSRRTWGPLLASGVEIHEPYVA